MNRAWAVLFASALAANSAAAATTDYTSFHILGDSLSDVGNVYRLSFGWTPESPPYWRGRFSNGPVWADHVADAFRDDDLPTGNHAWGGAKAATDWDGIPDLGLQAERYSAIDGDRRGDRPLVAIWAGGNDILAATGERGIRSVGRRAADAVGSAAEAVRRTGADDFLLFTLPDMGSIPMNAGDRDDSRSARRGTRAFNAALDQQIADLRSEGARVRTVGAYGLLQDVLANPRHFGVRDTTTPCYDGDSVCSRRQGRHRAFFDDIHPNFVIHERLSEAAMAQIDHGGMRVVAAAAAPVPQPAPAALLLGGLLALGLLTRRRGYQRSQRAPITDPSAMAPTMPSPYQTT